MALNAANYCPACRSTLDPTQPHQKLCVSCGFSRGVLTGEVLTSAVTVEALNKDKAWLTEENFRMAGGGELAEIAEECGGCGHGTLQFWTRQIRSADEGQTVYFLCAKCGWKKVENS